MSEDVERVARAILDALSADNPAIPPERRAALAAIAALTPAPDDDEFDRWLAEHDREVWKAGALRAATMCINEELFARLDGDGFGAVVELPPEQDGRRRRATFRRGDLPSLIAAIAERPEPEK